jgi:Arc/MetJ-type ribon-helix-helix transcriptional regulator
MGINIEFPEQLKKELEVITKTGHYKSTSEFVKDAVKTILAARKDLRVSIAVELYKEGYSLEKVAEIADVDYEEMKRILVESGIELRRGVETVEELEEGAGMLRSLRQK